MAQEKLIIETDERRDESEIFKYFNVFILVVCIFLCANSQSLINTIQNKTNRSAKLEFLVRYFDKTYSKEKFKNLQLNIPPQCYLDNITELMQESLNKFNVDLNNKNFNHPTGIDDFVIVENIDNEIVILEACLSRKNDTFSFEEKFGLLTIAEPA